MSVRDGICKEWRFDTDSLHVYMHPRMMNMRVLGLLASCFCLCQLFASPVSTVVPYHTPNIASTIQFLRPFMLLAVFIITFINKRMDCSNHYVKMWVKYLQELTMT